MTRFGKPWSIDARRDARRDAGGDFGEPEDSARARAFTRLWDRNWPEATPLAHLLRRSHADRWVRFHSLPGGKGVAGPPEERAGVLRRHLTVIRELQDEFGTSELVIVGADWGASDAAGGWTKTLIPAAWPWRVFTEMAQEDDHAEPGTHHFWVQSNPSIDQLDSLLQAAADDRALFLVTDSALSWLYAPYYAGADVILPAGDARDRLRQRHSDWLSEHPSGL